MKLSMKVIYEDGTEKRLVAKFSDFVAFERTWSRSVARFEHEIRLTDLAWLAWHVETRMKNTAKKFDPDFVETVVSVEVVPDDPTEALADSPLETTP